MRGFRTKNRYVSRRDFLMKSEYGKPEEYLGTLDKFANNKEVVDKYFVKPNGTNAFKPVS